MAYAEYSWRAAWDPQQLLRAGAVCQCLCVHLPIGTYVPEINSQDEKPKLLFNTVSESHAVTILDFALANSINVDSLDSRLRFSQSLDDLNNEAWVHEAFYLYLRGYR